MALYKIIASSLRWFGSIGKKFIRVVPWYTALIAVATLVSYFSLLLAFVFPLKVLILLGQAELPAYFPEVWQGAGRNYFIWVAVFATAAFYLLHLFSEKLITLCVEKGARDLLLKSKKISLFKNQNDIAMRSYQRYSRALASLCFILTGLIVIGVIYPILVGFLLGYGLLVFSLLTLLYSFSKTFKRKLIEELSEVITPFSAVGFFLGFGFIVLIFLYNPNQEITKAVIALLLMRQLVRKSTSLITDLASLFSQRHQINALFFHGQAFRNELSQQEMDFWHFTDLLQRNVWIKNVLQSVLGIDAHSIVCKWHPVNVTHILAFEVTALTANNAVIGHYLVKLFTLVKHGRASREASLLSEPNAASLPALLFLGATEVDEYPCHVFDLDNAQKIKLEDFKADRRIVLEQLFLYEPTLHLIKRYQRSRPLLGDRLESDMITKLSLLVHDQQQLKDLVRLGDKFAALRARFNALPVQIVNPEISVDTLVQTSNGKIKVMHWGKWAIEPLGSAWPIQRPKHLYRLLQQWQAQHPNRAETVATVDVRLASLLFAFESFYQEKRYNKSLELVPIILACEES